MLDIVRKKHTFRALKVSFEWVSESSSLLFLPTDGQRHREIPDQFVTRPFVSLLLWIISAQQVWGTDEVHRAEHAAAGMHAVYAFFVTAWQTLGQFSERLAVFHRLHSSEGARRVGQLERVAFSIVHAALRACWVAIIFAVQALITGRDDTARGDRLLLAELPLKLLATLAIATFWWQNETGVKQLVFLLWGRSLLLEKYKGCLFLRILLFLRDLRTLLRNQIFEARLILGRRLLRLRSEDVRRLLYLGGIQVIIITGGDDLSALYHFFRLLLPFCLSLGLTLVLRGIDVDALLIGQGRFPIHLRVVPVLDLVARAILAHELGDFGPSTAILCHKHEQLSVFLVAPFFFTPGCELLMIVLMALLGGAVRKVYGDFRPINTDSNFLLGPDQLLKFLIFLFAPILSIHLFGIFAFVCAYCDSFSDFYLWIIFLSG